MYTPLTTGAVVGTARPKTAIIRKNEIRPKTMLFVIPAPYIRIFAARGAFSSSSSSGSTNAPIGTTATRRPAALTLIPSTRERIPCPNSWTTSVITSASQTATVPGTNSLSPGIRSRFCGA